MALARALALKPWLLQDVQDQLHLGRSWLEEKNKAKAESGKPSAAVDNKWRGLYHDNGSCIDIIVSVISEHARVLVLKTAPLTITDGRHTTETSLTAACRSDLRARFPNGVLAVGTTWTVNKYTIRYTSYGPPRNKLRIILDAVDHVAVPPRTPASNATALSHSHEIASALQQIHNARVQDDDRCLRSQLPKDEHFDDDDGSYAMAGADEPSDADASVNTQMPFGTQIQHPTRSPKTGDEVSFVGINRMEPVLAGSTQRAELKPRSGTSADEQRRQAQLLSLLGKSRVQQPLAPQQSHTSVRHHAQSTPEPRKSREPVATTSPWPSEAPSKRATQDGIEARPTQTPQEKGKKRARGADTESPSNHSAKKASFSETQPRRRDASEDNFAVECPWMKGLAFNRVAATVPDDQTYILSKPESWAKQSNFPNPNIPMSLFTLLSRTIDENAALEGATSSGSFHETPSSGSYPANSAPQPTDERDSESEDEAPTSPVSWNTSPTPEPPERPTLPRQGLPPDSSLEVPEDLTEAANERLAEAANEHPLETAKPQRLVARREQPPPSTLPASSRENEEELPPSSPPAHLATLVSDDNVELETSVPQALGEDSPQPTLHPVQNYVPHTETRSTSVVQVKETPYTKGKNGQQPAVTVCPPTQESISHSSSASIVQGTYQELSSSVMEETRLDGLRKGHNEGQLGVASAGFKADVQGAQRIPDDDAQDMSMFEMFVHDEPTVEVVPGGDGEKHVHNLQVNVQAVQAQPEPTPMSAQLPSKDSSSGEQAATASTQTAMPVPTQQDRRRSRQPSDTPSLAKRKHETSPAQERRRGSKHKRAKLKYAFGGRDPQTLIRERNEFLRIERQKSTTSAESRQGSISKVSLQQDPDTEMEDLNDREPVKAQREERTAAIAGGMSPRHQSLYATPSPVLRPAAAPPAATTMTKSISLGQSRQDAPADQTIDKGISEEPVAVHQTKAPSQSTGLLAPQPEPQEERPSTSAPASVSHPVPGLQNSEVQINKEQTPPTAPDDSSAPSIFEKFKAAYPEYKANIKHFTNQCKQIEELDREDRMVPKWMWDDFIIRNRTDFAQYAAECIDAGEEPMKYIRFYKDTIRDAVHNKGVIGTRAILLKALQEVGVQPPTTKAPELQLPVQPAAQLPSERSSRPPAHQYVDARHPRRQSAQQSSREPVQPLSRQSAHRQTHSPMPPPGQPAITPLKKKASRKSLPFALPSNSASEHVNGTASIRHSLPASSFHAASESIHAQSPSTRPSSTQQKAGSSFGKTLRWYATEPSASPLETGTGNEYRDFIKAQEALSAMTGSKRVDKSKPWPRSLEVRPSVRDLPRKKIDVLEWKDEL